MRWFTVVVVFLVAFCACFLLWPNYDPAVRENSLVCAGLNIPEGSDPSSVQCTAPYSLIPIRPGGGYRYLVYSVAKGWPSGNEQEMLNLGDNSVFFRPLQAAIGSAGIVAVLAAGFYFAPKVLPKHKTRHR